MVPLFLSTEIGNLSMNKKSEFRMYNNSALLWTIRSFHFISDGQAIDNQK